MEYVSDVNVGMAKYYCERKYKKCKSFKNIKIRKIDSNGRAVSFVLIFTSLIAF